MIRNEEIGTYEFHENWTEVARKLGVSRQYVCKCRDEEIPCKGYILNQSEVWRVYLVVTVKGKRALCTARSGKKMFVVLGTGEEIGFRFVKSVKDITEACKNGQELVNELYNEKG